MSPYTKGPSHFPHYLLSLGWAFIRKKKSVTTWLIYAVEYAWQLFVGRGGTGFLKASCAEIYSLLLSAMMSVQPPTCVWMGCALMKMAASSVHPNQDLSWLQMGVTALVCMALMESSHDWNHLFYHLDKSVQELLQFLHVDFLYYSRLLVIQYGRCLKLPEKHTLWSVEHQSLQK